MFSFTTVNVVLFFFNEQTIREKTKPLLLSGFYAGKLIVLLFSLQTVFSSVVFLNSVSEMMILKRRVENSESERCCPVYCVFL